MGPQQGQSSGDAHVEAIDLTLSSSPEPEFRPHQQINAYARQQQPITKPKQEPKTSNTSIHGGNTSTQRQGSTRSGNVPPPQQPRQIHPHHVKQIIDTSSPRALRKIVLHLCQTSPALSGAVVRGLAPHSAYAQALIRGQQAKPRTQPTQTIKTENRSNEIDPNDRMKQRLAPSASTQSSAPRPSSNRPSAVAGNRDHLSLPSSKAAPRVKRENRASSTDSDDSTDIVDFPNSDRYSANAPRPGMQMPAGSSHRNSSVAHLDAERLAVRQRPMQESVPEKFCGRCGKELKEGENNCYYHPGPYYHGAVACCGKSADEPGCTFGQHVSRSVGSLTNSKRPSPSPNGSTQWLKKPRVL
ncbi:hypothetical protein EJ07DRAFT_154479 [Lizonia empirigonia]|nr:hypothetical protein EJ07DRAFT_154479 [Lizonia empirigonia]